MIAITVWPVYQRALERAPALLQRTAMPLLATLLTGIILILPVMLAVAQVAQMS